MSSVVPQSYDLMLIDGQGTAAAYSAKTASLALHDAQCPLGSAVLFACHQAFLREYGCLSLEDQLSTGLDLAAMASPYTFLTNLFTVPQPNPLKVKITLYLTQLLRYVAHLDPSSCTITTHSDRDHALLGFSTGMFASSVIASAYSAPSLITYAVEAFRLAFWIGFRAQQYADTALAGTSASSTSPWSLVAFGATRQELQDAVDRVNNDYPVNPRMCVSAVTHATCISISGRPDVLSIFQKEYLPASATGSRFLALHTLYHSPELLEVKNLVMHDIHRRHINFPTYESLLRPLCNPVSGLWITTESAQSSEWSTLAEAVVDMTLLEPVNFDAIINELTRELAEAQVPFIRLITVGPGDALLKAVSRSLPRMKIESLDWTSEEPAVPEASTHAIIPLVSRPLHESTSAPHAAVRIHREGARMVA